jgi:LDH2 family malate/lactate/ureidoglycolate dehydrogenase
MADTGNLYHGEELARWTADVFQAAGAARPDAEETARVLVRTNLRGVDTHGVARVLMYVEKVRSGEVNARAKPVSDLRDGVLHFDGDGGLGQSVGMHAVREAIARASEQPVVVCLIRRSGHLAALGQFVLEAAERGMVALMCQETPPLMALRGSGRPAIGNNPIAFAAPVRDGPPIVFDMATSVVARGNVLQAVKDGREQLPEGWAIGPDGEPTVDPQLALKGAMLPIADHKGVGLAMMVQVLAGSLTASATAQSAASHGAMSSAGNVSAFLMVINPDLAVGRDLFDNHMADWIATYRAASGSGSRYPGQRAAETELARVRDGVPLPPSIVADLRKVGDLAGRPFDLKTIRTS